MLKKRYVFFFNPGGTVYLKIICIYMLFISYTLIFFKTEGSTYSGKLEEKIHCTGRMWIGLFQTSNQETSLETLKCLNQN